MKPSRLRREASYAYIAIPHQNGEGLRVEISTLDTVVIR